MILGVIGRNWCRGRRCLCIFVSAAESSAKEKQQVKKCWCWAKVIESRRQTSVRSDRWCCSTKPHQSGDRTAAQANLLCHQLSTSKRFFLKRKKIQRMIRQTPSGGKDITAVFCVHKSIFIVSFYPALQALYGLWLNIHAGISLCQSRRTERAASDGSQTNSHWGKWVKLICTWSFILYYKTISLLSLSVAQTEDADWRKTAKVVKKEQWFPAALLFLILHTFFPFNVLIHTHFEVCVDTISAGVSYSLLRLFKNEAMGLWCQTSKRSLWMKMARDMSAS